MDGRTSSPCRLTVSSRLVVRCPDVNSRDAPRPLPDADLVAGRRQRQLRMNQDVAGRQFAVGVRRELNLPLAGDVLDRRERPRQPVEISTKDGRVVQFSKLLIQRAGRLLLQHRRYPFNTGELVRMEIHDEAARRERRVFERLEVGSHVLENRLDDVSCRAPGRRWRLGTHVDGLDTI